MNSIGGRLVNGAIVDWKGKKRIGKLWGAQLQATRIVLTMEVATGDE